MEGRDPRKLLETIANNLKRLRSKYNDGQGLYQKDIAEHLGIRQQTYAAYENATIQIQIETLCMIADFYNVSVQSLITTVEEGQKDRALEKLRSFNDDEFKEIMSFADYVESKRKKR